MDQTRQQDLQQLRREYSSTSDPLKRKMIAEAGQRIQQQSYNGRLNSARQALLRETRKGNTENAKDIRLEITKMNGL